LNYDRKDAIKINIIEAKAPPHSFPTPHNIFSHRFSAYHKAQRIITEK
jgi:hypothetical protein